MDDRAYSLVVTLGRGLVCYKYEQSSITSANIHRGQVKRIPRID